MQHNFIIHECKENNKVIKKMVNYVLRQVEMEKNLLEILDIKEIYSH